MTRLRGVLIDNTAGRVYANSNTAIGTTSDQLIAGSRKSTLSLSLKPPGTALSAVTATQGNLFNSPGLISNITYKWVNSAGNSTNAAAPTITASNVALRKVSSAGVSTRTFYNLPKTAANGVITSTSVTITPGDTFFWDVISAGNLPGQGLVIIMDYYLG